MRIEFQRKTSIEKAQVDYAYRLLAESLCVPTHLQTDPVLSDVGALHAG